MEKGANGPAAPRATETTEKTEEGGKAESRSSGNMLKLISPEAVVMLPLAVLLDLAGVILILVGLDDFGLTDIIGILIIGGWTYFRSQTARVTRQAAQRIGKATKWAKQMKWLRPLCIILEFIPYAGWLPGWTVLVFFELQE